MNLSKTFHQYLTVPRVPVVEEVADSAEPKVDWRPKYSIHESILQTLWDNGIELESLESYVKEDTDRMTNKLSTLHERMKSHLAELLRPALSTENGPAGDREFHDGSEQFVGGDFAEELQEDFFGFKELGLDKEFGLGVSVPLHLLQNRMYTAHQSQNTKYVPSPYNPSRLLTIVVHPAAKKPPLLHPRLLTLLLLPQSSTRSAWCRHFS